MKAQIGKYGVKRGYRLLAADGVDFGSQSFWFTLPVGSSQGVVAGPFAWSVQ